MTTLTIDSPVTVEAAGDPIGGTLVPENTVTVVVAVEGPQGPAGGEAYDDTAVLGLIATETSDREAADGTLASALSDGLATKASVAALAGKADAAHTHDDRYYTEAEVDALLASAGGGGGIVPLTVADSGTAYTATAPDHGEARTNLTLTGNCALTLAGGTDAEVCAVQLHLTQDATGGRTVTWPSTLDWGLNGAPVLSTLPGKTDRMYLTTDDGGASWQGALVGNGYTTPVVPGAPTAVSATPAMGEVTLGWTQAPANGSSVTQNKVYRAVTGGTLTLLATIAADTTYTDTTVTNGTTYDYAVSAVNAVGEGVQSAVATATPGTVTLAGDPFDRADATATSPSDGLIGQTTPVGGKTWLNPSGAGAWSVAGNAAVCSSANRKAMIDAGAADVTVSADVNVAGGQAMTDQGIVFRYVDANNYCAAIIDPGGYYVQKWVGGTQSNVANGGGSLPAGTSPRLSVVLDGTSVIVKADGVVKVTTTIADAVLLAGTKHGLLTGGSAAVTFNNFEVTSP